RANVDLRSALSWTMKIYPVEVRAFVARHVLAAFVKGPLQLKPRNRKPIRLIRRALSLLIRQPSERGPIVCPLHVAYAFGLKSWIGPLLELGAPAPTFRSSWALMLAAEAGDIGTCQ